PVGNQLYRTMHNTDGHYQDNKAEIIFGNIGRLRSAGVVALLFGSDEPSTQPWDSRHDGVTNPAPVCTSDGGAGSICPTLRSVLADDDGGFLRVKAAEYYRNPATVSLPSAVTRAKRSIPLIPIGAVLVAGAFGGTAVVWRKRR